MGVAAFAAILLIGIGRRLHWAVVAPLLAITVAAALTSHAPLVDFGLLYFFMSFLGLVIPGEGGAWLAIGLSSNVSFFIMPVHRLFMMTGLPAFNLTEFAFSNAYWKLVIVLAVGAVTTSAAAQKLPTMRGRVFEALAGPWPTGRRAAVITIIALLAWLCLNLASLHIHKTTALLEPALVALVVYLRVTKQHMISWGAWILAVAAAAELFINALTWTSPQPIFGQPSQLLPVIEGFVGAVLLLLGPRPEYRRSRFGWAVYFLAFGLPGLGWLWSSMLLHTPSAGG
jgi:hypothetical protein